MERFHEIITGTKFIGQDVYSPSNVENIPKLRSNHKRGIIDGLICHSFDPEMRRMLEQFRHSLIHLKLWNCEFDPMTLYEFLSEFPLLETIELNIKVTMKTSMNLTHEELFKLWNFKNFKLEINFDKRNGILTSMNSIIQWKITKDQNI